MLRLLNVSLFNAVFPSLMAMSAHDYYDFAPEILHK